MTYFKNNFSLLITTITKIKTGKYSLDMTPSMINVRRGTRHYEYVLCYFYNLKAKISIIWLKISAMSIDMWKADVELRLFQPLPTSGETGGRGALPTPMLYRTRYKQIYSDLCAPPWPWSRPMRNILHFTNLMFEYKQGIRMKGNKALESKLAELREELDQIVFVRRNNYFDVSIKSLYIRVCSSVGAPCCYWTFYIQCS